MGRAGSSPRQSRERLGRLGLGRPGHLRRLKDTSSLGVWKGNSRVCGVTIRSLLDGRTKEGTGRSADWLNGATSWANGLRGDMPGRTGEVKG